MAITIECRDCDYCTDIELISETNPYHCPECGGELLIAGTGDPLYGDDGEHNASLYDND